MRHKALRVIRLCAGTAAVCVGAVLAVDNAAPHLATVPHDTLLARHSVAQGTTLANSREVATYSNYGTDGSTTPWEYFPVDMCEVSIPSDKHFTVDHFVSVFSSSPLFSLERRLLSWAGVNPSNRGGVKPSKASVKGTLPSLWSVDSRGPSEVLFVWRQPTALGHPTLAGSTYFRVIETRQPGLEFNLPVTEGSVTTLQFGSGIDLTSFGEMSSSGTLGRVVMRLHYFYSKCLLLNTAAMIRWGGY